MVKYDFLNGVEAIVEATDFEKHCLWERNNSSKTKKMWEENLSGYMITVGHYHDMPVCISLTTTTVGGKKILFLYPISVVVNHTMIREWIDKNVGKNLRIHDPINFHNVLN